MGLNAPKEKLDEIPDEVRATAAATLLIARAVQLLRWRACGCAVGRRGGS